MEVIKEWLPPLSWGTSLLAHASALFMMIGGVIPYVPQYLEIRKTKNADGFSTYVCLALLVANILRINFWFGHRFESPLLFQSIIMTVAMLIMMKLCISTRNLALANQPPQRPKTFHQWEWNNFWQWTDFLSYLECMCLFTLACAMLMTFFRDIKFFVEAVGFVSVFTEAILGLPQFWKNYTQKSTAGMSTSMVMLWLFGDLFKTVYFISRVCPIQFIICGCLQVTIDLAIFQQMWLYRRRSSVKVLKNVLFMRSSPSHSS